MKRKKLKTCILATILSLCVLSTTAFAATDYCQFLVGNKQCGYPISPKYTGKSVDYSASHKYDTILGLGGNVCNYTYYYGYYNNQCSQGHVSSSFQVRVEYGHTCGK